MIEIAPSLLSADFSNLNEEVKKVEKAGIKYLHFDIMDGHFVPNLTMGPMVVKALRSKTQILFDVHLMLDNPENFIQIFKDAGADIITVHYEAGLHLHRLISMIKNLNILVGVSINPATPESVLEYILPDVDLVLVMSVNPGFGGQKFIASSLDKIKALKTMIDKKNLRAKIEVDGGIDLNTAPLVVKAGAEILVAGSSVFGTQDPYEALIKLQAIAKVSDKI